VILKGNAWQDCSGFNREAKVGKRKKQKETIKIIE